LFPEGMTSRIWIEEDHLREVIGTHGGIRMVHVGWMRKMVLVAVLAVSVSADGVTAGSASQIPKEPIKWTMQVNLPEAPLKPGDKLTIQLNARIDEGWHLYSLDQTEGGPIPTRIVLPSEQSFEEAGSIESSEPKAAMDPNFNLMTHYYEEQAAFLIPVKVAAGAPAGKTEVKVNISFQTCNDELCLPPKTVKLSAPVNISR
jgi:DsbC/DsbD-like thiol-disulfide interchange protein